MKKLLKNKVLVLVICVTIVSCTYFLARKAINEYTFKTNGDIIREDEVLSDNNMPESSSDKNVKDDSGIVAEEETELVLEETNESTETTESEISEKTSSGKEQRANESNKIYVYITGEVNVPGVVILNENSRIVDAINAAGGTTAKANVSKVNLVYVLEDGMKINIPNNNDLKNNPDFEYITMSSGDGASDSESVSHNENSTDDRGGDGSRDYSNKNSIVNINSATQTELESLPGIGPSLALKIINYRNENGKFSSIDQIKNVSGIGDAKFENMKSLITV